MEADLAALIGRNIRAARLALPDRPNGRQLAEKLKELDPQRAPNHQRVSDWERGVQKPDDRYMKSLSTALEKPVAWFYEEHEELEEPTPEPFQAVDATHADRLEERLAAIEKQLLQLSAIQDKLTEMAQDNESRGLELISHIDERTAPLQAAPRRRRRA